MEILIHNKSTLRNTLQSSGASHTSKWFQRGFMLTGLFVVLGNVPVSSHLLETQSNKTNSFEITLNNLPSKSEPIDLEAITSDSATPEINETDALNNLTYVNKEIVSEEIDIEDSQELELPLRAIETYVGHVIDDANSKWKTYHVKSYDNLTNIFHKINQQEVLKPLQKNKKIARVLSKLKKGSIARAKSIDGKLAELVFTRNNIDSFIITQKDGAFKGEWKKHIFEVRQARASFTINNGLFFDGRKAGVTDKVVKQIVKVFDWDIDFSHDVRIGDKVTAVYEEIFHDGDKVDSRHLLAAEFINKGHAHRAIRYTFANGKADYFTPQGREMKKAFIRTPVAHARVSSHFNPSRYHPKLHKIRAHKGTDFSARTGTAIMATGNGKIKFIGRKGGYGRTVVIQHREGYTTLYAHMSKYKKGLKQGDTVIQGETIGYVGRSGLASGPHLHYEFRHNDKPVNPMTVSLPNSMSLSSRELKDFRSDAVNLVLQLNVLHRFAKAKIEINSAFGG